MASLSRKKSGVWQIQFALDRKRKTLSLGSISAKDARSVKAHVEAILETRWVGGSLPQEETGWLERIDDSLHAKLAALDLVHPRTQSQLGPFLAGYIAGRTDVGGYTTRNLKDAAARLTDFFGDDREIKSISKADAKAWAIWLVEQEYAGATRGRTIKRARQFFAHAVDARFLAENVFKSVKAPPQSNRDRVRFIDEATSQKVLAACPSPVWRLRFALARYGGLRTPLEARRMKWIDINWELDRFGVRGKGGDGSVTRMTPLFPELRKALNAVWDDPAAGDVFVLPPLSHTKLRAGLLKILAAAGITPWPRIWQNLRLTRHSELSSVYPRHVVCDWLGNSEEVAEEHYKTVTDDQFRLASEGKTFAAPTLQERPVEEQQ
jgi:hypothetical protein